MCTPEGFSMEEQTAILAHDNGEWVLITDDDEPERIWCSEWGKRSYLDVRQTIAL